LDVTTLILVFIAPVLASRVSILVLNLNLGLGTPSLAVSTELHSPDLGTSSFSIKLHSPDPGTSTHGHGAKLCSPDLGTSSLGLGPELQSLSWFWEHILNSGLHSRRVVWLHITPLYLHCITYVNNRQTTGQMTNTTKWPAMHRTVFQPEPCHYDHI